MAERLQPLNPIRRPREGALLPWFPLPPVRMLTGTPTRHKTTSAASANSWKGIGDPVPPQGSASIRGPGVPPSTVGLARRFVLHGPVHAQPHVIPYMTSVPIRGTV